MLLLSRILEKQWPFSKTGCYRVSYDHHARKLEKRTPKKKERKKKRKKEKEDPSKSICFPRVRPCLQQKKLSKDALDRLDR
jgi:hypothetical protein